MDCQNLTHEYLSKFKFTNLDLPNSLIDHVKQVKLIQSKGKKHNTSSWKRNNIEKMCGGTQ